MDIIKDQSILSTQFTVKASRTSKRSRTKRKLEIISNKKLYNLPTPLEYYAKELKKFHPQKKQAIALCPFHHDRNPSFSVNLETGAFICFACGVCGRTIISFHIKRYRLSKQEALKVLGRA